MTEAIKNPNAKILTRRTMLGSGVACVVASMVPQKMLAEITRPIASSGDNFAANPNRLGAALYAFPGLQEKTTVIAATWQARSNNFAWGTQNDSQVAIHAGSQSWSVKVPGGITDAALLEQNGCRIFVGNVANQSDANGAELKAVVVELPSKMLSGSAPVTIWAERVMHSGSRQRVGSPFIAALVADDSGLAKLYHSVSPADDRAELTEGISNAIAAKARKGGSVNDPEAYGRRLTSRLLPDVLHYHPELPAGFTFAAQNGLHPEETSALVVETILSGTPASPSAKASIRLQESFPYLARHASIA